MVVVTSVSSDCLAVQIPKDVRYISRLKIFKEGCQGDVNIYVTAHQALMLMEIHLHSKARGIWLKTGMLNFTNKGADW